MSSSNSNGGSGSGCLIVVVLIALFVMCNRVEKLEKEAKEKEVPVNVSK